MATMSDFVQQHKTLAIGGGIALLAVGYLLSRKSKTTATNTAPTADLTGLTNGLVYVPTQTTFSTTNESGLFASGDPNLTTISTGQIGNSSSTTTNKPTIITGGWKKPTGNPPPPPPQRKPPVSNPQDKGLLGSNIRFYPNYRNGLAYYRGPNTNGQIIQIPLPANTVYIPGSSGRVWYQSPPGSTQKLLTSGG